MGAVPRLENGWAATPWGFDSLSFRLASLGAPGLSGSVLPHPLGTFTLSDASGDAARLSPG